MSYSRPPGANVKETNLYICNLGPSASEERLDELFGEFGTILTRHGLFESFSCVNRKWSKDLDFTKFLPNFTKDLDFTFYMQK